MEILSLVSQHVKAVNRMYSETKFERVKEGPLVVLFDVERLKVHNYTMVSEGKYSVDWMM